MSGQGPGRDSWAVASVSTQGGEWGLSALQVTCQVATARATGQGRGALLVDDNTEGG